MEGKSEIVVVGLSESESKAGHYVLVCEEPKSKKRLPIIIGEAEAQSIAIFMEHLLPSRPLTHDLFKKSIDSLNAKFKEAFIKSNEQDIYYSDIILTDENQKEIIIDARPSDAIALAIRFEKPIYIAHRLLDRMSFEVEELSRDKKGSYLEYTIGELEILLEKILKKEDYESAIRIKEAIERRKARS